MLESVDRVVTAGVDGVKFHNLHILSKAPLGQRWREHPFPVLSESAYLECLMLALRRLPADLPVFRVFTDSDNRERLAPAREFSKGEFITELAQRLRTRGWRQGDRREEGRVEGWKVES
jgi:radical SAM superfamily enzyme